MRRRVVSALLAVVAVAIVGYVVLIALPGRASALGNGYKSHREIGWTGIDLVGFQLLDPTSVTDSTGMVVTSARGDPDRRLDVPPGAYVIRPCSDSAGSPELHVDVGRFYHTVVDAPGVAGGWGDVCHGLSGR